MRYPSFQTAPGWLRARTRRPPSPCWRPGREVWNLPGAQPLHGGGTNIAKLLPNKGTFPSNVAMVEMKGEEVQLTVLDFID